MKDAFAKKFFGAGRDSAGGALASVLRVKAGHLMRPSAQRKVPRGHEDEERLTADIIGPCLASTNKSLA